MKNVSGYDMARMHIGALGTLGIIAEVSFKLTPLPARQATVLAACSIRMGVASMPRWRYSGAVSFLWRLRRCMDRRAGKREEGGIGGGRPSLMPFGSEDGRRSVERQTDDVASIY